jgi:hypothetical protein
MSKFVYFYILVGLIVVVDGVGMGLVVGKVGWGHVLGLGVGMAVKLGIVVVEGLLWYGESKNSIKDN